MTAYDEIDLVCPKCHGLEIKEVSRYIGTTDVRVFIDKMTGARLLDYPSGYTDIDWDSGETDEDSPLECQNCLWQGKVEDLVVAPDEPEPTPPGDVEVVLPKDLVDRFRKFLTDEDATADQAIALVIELMRVVTGLRIPGEDL